MKSTSLKTAELNLIDVGAAISQYVEKELGWKPVNVKFVYSIDDDTGEAHLSTVQVDDGPLVETPVDPKKARRQKYVDKYGEEIVDEAEGYYETYFDKDFWYDLDDYEVMDYISRAKWHLRDKLRSEA